MKNLIIIVFLIGIFLNTSPAQAKTVIAEVINEINTQNPPEEFCVKVTKKCKWYDGYSLEEGCIIKGEITEIVPPKIGKRDAFLKFTPKSFSIPSKDGKITELELSQIIKVKPYKPMTKIEIAGKVVTTAAGTVVDGLGYGINFVQGAVQAKEGEHRVKAGINNAYEASPLSYGRKGYHRVFKEGDLVKLSLDEIISE